MKWEHEHEQNHWFLALRFRMNLYLFWGSKFKTSSWWSPQSCKTRMLRLDKACKSIYEMLLLNVQRPFAKFPFRFVLWVWWIRSTRVNATPLLYYTTLSDLIMFPRTFYYTTYRNQPTIEYRTEYQCCQGWSQYPHRPGCSLSEWRLK